MSDRTEIAWAESTWNPVTGCTKISPACEHCYIERTPPFRMAHRKFDQPGIGGRIPVELHPGRLTIPDRWRKPRRIFVCSLADLFHQDVPDDYIAQVFAVMARHPQHVFQVLTKRSARMRSLLSSDAFAAHVQNMCLGGASWPLPNVWVGVTAENQKWAGIRIPDLLGTPAAVRWVSAEPLLGPIDLTRLPFPRWSMREAARDGIVLDAVHHLYGVPGLWSGAAVGIDWLVIGGESGPGARPMHPQWVRDLRDQCAGTDVAMFFKQWGEWLPVEPDVWQNRHETDHDVRADGYHWPISEPHGADDGSEIVMRRVGKKAAGRLLDSVLHDAYPAVTA